MRRDSTATTKTVAPIDPTPATRFMTRRYPANLDSRKGERGAGPLVIRLDDDVVDSLTHEQFVSLSDGLTRPVLLPGLVRSEPAMGWTLDGLLGRDPARVIEAEHYRDGDRRRPYERVHVTCAELAVKIASEPTKWFLAEKDLDHTFASIAGELGPLTFLPDAPRQLLRMVFFGRDTQSATHFHVRDQAVLSHLAGHKRVVLATPEAPLATNSMFGSRPQFSTHGPDAGEDAGACFERLVGDRCEVVDLEPGDALFIPVHWWHWVEGTGECLSVTTFWRADRRAWVFPRPGVRAAVAASLALAAGALRNIVGLRRSADDAT